MSGNALANAPNKESLITKIQHMEVSNGVTSTTDKRVLVLDFKQPVVKYSNWNYLGTQDYIKILRNCKNNPEIGAIVLDVDSGGGQAFGTPEFYDALKEFTSVKPLVVYSGGYLCSAAYYFSAPATKIIVNPRAEAIGSIGAYTTLVDVNGFYEKFGAKVHTIYSSLSNDKNKAYRAVMEGADADYSQYVKLELDPLVLQFRADMTKVRPSLAEKVLEGGTWKGVEAVELGLADATGSLEDAINEAFSLIDVNLNNQSKNKKAMAKLTLPGIEKVLGLEESLEVKTSLLSTKATASLTQDQLEVLNQNLEAGEQNIATLSAENASLVTKNETLTTANTNFETALNAALTKAGLEAGENALASIELLADKVVEFGGKPGTEHSTSTSDGDKALDADKPSYSIFDSLIK